DPITPGVTAWFDTPAFNDWYSTALPAPRPIDNLFVNIHDLHNLDPRPAVGSELRGNVRWGWQNLQDPFFQQADYRGAFAPDVPMSQQWTAGWTDFDPQHADHSFASVAKGRVSNVAMLAQNSPNPFNPSTTIRFSLRERGQVSLKIFNVSGQAVATLVDGELAAGSYQKTVDTKDLAPGTYFYSLSCNGYSETRKMVVLK
ncbi:MAG TPA: T9SS type A sorting domain-containing protein, partial [bacterium]|nr:T9SS type A sorting domain-containing protein [bacterium]